MNALIFAAGLGTRLAPLTHTMPKALVPVDGTPALQLLIEKLKSEGFDHIVINVHHFAEQIVDFVRRHDSFGLDIRFSDETGLLLDTGGGLKAAARLFPNDDPILTHNVDILSSARLADLYAGARGDATLLVSGRKTTRYLLADADNRLVGWVNTATGQTRGAVAGVENRFAFSGIQVVRPSLLPLMREWEGPFSIIDFYLSVCGQADIRLLPDPSLRLLDIGKPQSLARAGDFIRDLILNT